jgi:hypothetical protein
MVMRVRGFPLVVTTGEKGVVVVADDGRTVRDHCQWIAFAADEAHHFLFSMEELMIMKEYGCFDEGGSGILSDR